MTKEREYSTIGGVNNIKKRGFASLTPARRKELASKGGQTSQKKGTAYRFTHEKAVEAGKKGKKKSATISL